MFAPDQINEDSDLKTYLRMLGLKDPDIVEFMGFALQYGSLADAGCQHAFKVLSAIHEFSWIKFEYFQSVLEVSQGVLAGTPLAYILFTYLMFKVLTEVRKCLLSEDLIAEIPLDFINLENI